MTIIEWDTVKNWVYDWITMVNNAFDTAMQALTISPFNSSISAIDTALAAVEGVALVLVSMFFAIELCNEANSLCRDLLCTACFLHIRSSACQDL